jgi:cytochrome c553
MHITPLLALSIGLSALSSSAAADTAPISAHVRGITATCFTCHGTDGKSNGAIPSLAGLEKGYFVQQMQDFKSGKREATVMHQHAKGYSDADFIQMADFFAALKP